MQDEMFIQYLKFLIQTEKDNEDSLREKAHKAVEDYILGIQLDLNRGV